MLYFCIQCFWLQIWLGWSSNSFHPRSTYRGIHEKGSNDVVTLYTLSIYPSEHKQPRRHHPNPFREFPCSSTPMLEQCMPRKGFGEFASAVCDTIYTIYLYLCTNTADPNSPNPFRGIDCMYSTVNIINVIFLNARQSL